MAADATAVCRYCFEGDAEEVLISPCRCAGHQRWVHPTCLIKWQRKQARSTACCEVCKAEWTVLLAPLDRELWTRSVKTNPRYQPVDDDVLDADRQARFRDRMRPGTLILQTPLKAQQTQQNIQQQLTLTASDNGPLAFFASMLTVQRGRHWLRGCFLILSRGAADGTDGSDSIVAINLTRVAAPEAADREARAELKPLLDALAPAAPTLVVGGPCHQTNPICLLELPESAELPARGDRLLIPLSDAAEGDGEGGGRVVVAAEPVVAASILGTLASIDDARVLVVQGCAIWSTEQLLSEMSQHKWGLVTATRADLPFGCTPPPADHPAEEGEAEASEGHEEMEATAGASAGLPLKLWARCWQEREPLCTPEPPPPPEQPLQSLDQEADTERVEAGGAQDEGQLVNAEADQTEEERGGL